MKWRASARRAALAAAGLSLVAAVVGPGADAQEGEAPATSPDSFASSASASALTVEGLTPALVPVEGLFEFAAAEGRGTYEPATQEARASLVFPGNGVVLGPNLLCGTFLGPNMAPDGQAMFGPILASCAGAQYPLAVFADSLQPDGQTEGAAAVGSRTDPLSMQAAGARAHAALDSVTTDSEVQDLRLLGAPGVGALDPLLQAAGVPATDATVLAADAMTAVTDQRILDGGLVVESTATVSGLRLLGGLVRIGSIVSRSTLTDAPGADPVVDAALEVSGVEVAGTPAQLTEDGLALGGPPSGPLAQQLVRQAAAALEGSDLRVELLPSERGEVDGIPFATVGGVLVEMTAPLQGLPPVPGPLGDADVNGAYGVRAQIGTTGVRGFADSFDDDSPPPSPVPAAGSGGGGVDGGAPAGARPAVPSGPAPALSPPATPSVATPTADVGDAGLVADLFADRLAFLYLSFTLTALALCLAPRLTLPARLPR